MPSLEWCPVFASSSIIHRFWLNFLTVYKGHPCARICIEDSIGSSSILPQQRKQDTTRVSCWCLCHDSLASCDNQDLLDKASLSLYIHFIFNIPHIARSIGGFNLLNIIGVMMSNCLRPAIILNIIGVIMSNCLRLVIIPWKNLIAQLVHFAHRSLSSCLQFSKMIFILLHQDFALTQVGSLFVKIVYMPLKVG